MITLSMLSAQEQATVNRYRTHSSLFPSDTHLFYGYSSEAYEVLRDCNLEHIPDSYTKLHTYSPTEGENEVIEVLINHLSTRTIQTLLPAD